MIFANYIRKKLLKAGCSDNCSLRKDVSVELNILVLPPQFDYSLKRPNWEDGRTGNTHTHPTQHQKTAAVFNSKYAMMLPLKYKLQK